MRKLFALILALVMVLSLAACGGKDDPKPSGNSGTGDTPPASTQQEPASTPGSDTSKPTEEKTATEYLEAFDLSAIEIPVEKVSQISDYTAMTDKNNVEILFNGIEADEFTAIAQSVFNALSAKGAVSDNYGNAVTSYEEALGGFDDDYYGFKAAGYEVSISYYPESLNTFEEQDMKLALKMD